MTRPREVSQLTTAKLETARRLLRANLGMITPDSPRARADPGAHAGNRCRARRTRRRPGSLAGASITTADASGPPPPLGPAGRDRGVHEPPARPGLDAERNQG